MALSPLKLRKEITAAALVKEIANPQGWVYSVTLAPDGNTLLLGGYGEIDLVDLAEGTSKRVQVEAAQREAVSQIRFTSDGGRVVATMWNGFVAVLEWPMLRPIAAHAVSSDRLHACAVMPDGRSAWVGGHDCKRTRIDLETGKVIASQGGEWGWVSDAALSPDGKTLVTGDAATVVRICDGKTGVERTKLKLGIAHNIVVTDEQALVPSLEMAIVNLASGRAAKKYPGEHKLGASAAVLVDKGRMLVSVGHHDPLMVLWDCGSCEPLLTMKPLKKGVFASIVVAGAHVVTVPTYEAPLQVWRTEALIVAARKGPTAKK